MVECITIPTDCHVLEATGDHDEYIGRHLHPLRLTRKTTDHTSSMIKVDVIVLCVRNAADSEAACLRESVAALL